MSLHEQQETAEIREKYFLKFSKANKNKSNSLLILTVAEKFFYSEFAVLTF